MNKPLKLNRASFNYPVIEASKRGYDGSYAVWQYYSPYMIYRGAFNVENTYIYDGVWVLTDVFSNKKTTTTHLKKKYGSNCFKNTDDFNITYV
jgi:hypothetical protein